MNFFSSAALIGMGKSNLALARFLLKNRIKLSLRDKNVNTRIPNDLLSSPFVSVSLGDSYLSDIRADCIFLSPSVRLDTPEILQAKERGITVSSEIEYFFSLCPSPIIAVTGSDGKTTTATLCHSILSKKYGDRAFLLGNVGTPAVSALDDIKHDDICVVEMSSFQLMGFLPECAASLITNITENHLNWHTDVREYVQAKMNVYKNTSLCVINADDPTCSEIRIAGSIYFSTTKTQKQLARKYGGARFVFIERGDVFITEHGTGERTYLFSLSDIKIPGEHNIKNALAAASLTYDFTSQKDIRAAVSEFEGVEHRCSFLGEIDGIKYIESSIDSTPSRTAATLCALGENANTTVICGGSDKKLSYLPLSEALSKYASFVVFTGECGVEMMNALTSHPSYNPKKTGIMYIKEFENAVKLAISKTEKGGTVVLSPAATSFDCFSNYIERAERFCAIVRNRSDRTKA